MSAGLVFLSDDRLVQEGPGDLHAFMFDCSADGGVLAIYDGLNSDSGRLLVHTEGWQYDNNHVVFMEPVPFEIGLYVTLDANVSDASIQVSPKRSYSIPKVEDIARAILDLINQ